MPDGCNNNNTKQIRRSLEDRKPAKVVAGSRTSQLSDEHPQLTILLSSPRATSHPESPDLNVGQSVTRSSPGQNDQVIGYPSFAIDTTQQQQSQEPQLQHQEQLQEEELYSIISSPDIASQGEPMYTNLQNVSPGQQDELINQFQIQGSLTDQNMSSLYQNFSPDGVSSSTNGNSPSVLAQGVGHVYHITEHLDGLTSVQSQQQQLSLGEHAELFPPSVEQVSSHGHGDRYSTNEWTAQQVSHAGTQMMEPFSNNIQSFPGPGCDVSSLQLNPQAQQANNGQFPPPQGVRVETISNNQNRIQTKLEEFQNQIWQSDCSPDKVISFLEAALHSWMELSEGESREPASDEALANVVTSSGFSHILDGDIEAGAAMSSGDIVANMDVFCVDKTQY